MSNSSIWPIYKNQSGATTSGQSEPGSDANEGWFCIPQSASITVASQSCFYCNIQGTRWLWSYTSAKVQFVYYIAQTARLITILNFWQNNFDFIVSFIKNVSQQKKILAFVLFTIGSFILLDSKPPSHL